MKTAIIRYNAGNTESVRNALLRLGAEAEVTSDPVVIRSAGRVIFPGVGEAAHTMEYLRQTGLDELLLSLRQPVLGICLGLQLMCAHSEEGDTPCLGIFGEKIRKFVPGAGRETIDKVPHMGWNSLHGVKEPLFSPGMEGGYVYFVHSYYAETGDHTVARSAYVTSFSAALRKDNFFATQFHPEKSGTLGAAILANFLKL